MSGDFVEEEVDYLSDCEPTEVTSFVDMSEPPVVQKTELELLREENNLLKELLKLQSTGGVTKETELVLPSLEPVNVIGDKPNDNNKINAECTTRDIDRSSAERDIEGVKETNDLGCAHSSDNNHVNPNLKEDDSLTHLVASTIQSVGERVCDAGKALLEQPVPPLLVDYPVVDPHPPMDPPPPQAPPSPKPVGSTEDHNGNKKCNIVNEPPSASSMHTVEESAEESVTNQGAPSALAESTSPPPPLSLDTEPPHNDSTDEHAGSLPGYSSATSATSPPFIVDEALIFRAKENATRREGVTNVCADFVQGICTLGEGCPLSHDAVPVTHCLTYNCTGQCFDDLCPLLHRLVEYDPAPVVSMVPVHDEQLEVQSLTVQQGEENSSEAQPADQERSTQACHADEMNSSNIHAVTGVLVQASDTEAVGTARAQGTQDDREAPRDDIQKDAEQEHDHQEDKESSSAATSTTLVEPTSFTIDTPEIAMSLATTADLPQDTSDATTNAGIVVTTVVTASVATATSATTSATAGTTAASLPTAAVVVMSAAKTPAKSNSSFEQLLDTYQHHSHQTDRCAVSPPSNVTHPTTSINRATSIVADPVKQKEDGEVCEGSNSAHTMPVKKSSSRFDEDTTSRPAPIRIDTTAGAATTGSSAATLPLSCSAHATSPSAGVCYNFKRGACDRGNSCKFSHDRDADARGVCYAFQNGACDKGDSCRFQHVAAGPCFNFRRGTCDRGDSCRFSHDPTAKLDRGVCFAFQKGSCSKGDSCMYAHDAEAKAEVCRAFLRGECRNGDRCYYRHEQEACRDFQRGHCPRGETCFYLHDSAGAGARGSGVPAPVLITSTAAPQPIDKPPCYAFMKGTCSLGDECRYSHAGSIFGTPGVCNLFQRGECMKGDTCKYKHELEACRAFLRGYCKNGDRCNYHHPGCGADTSISHQQPSQSHYQPPPSKRGRSPSRSPSRSKEVSRSSHHRHRDASHSRDRAEVRVHKQAKRNHSSSPSRAAPPQVSRSPPRDPARYYTEHDYDRGRHTKHVSHSPRPVTTSSTTSHYAGPPPIEEAVFGEADKDTQRRARDNEKRRSTIANPCARAYAGKCQLGDKCASSHDVIPYAYCRLFNNTGCCHKVGCPYIHELYQYRAVSENNGDHSPQPRSHHGSSRRGRSPSPVFARHSTGGSDSSSYMPQTGNRKYAPATPPSPQRNYQVQQSQRQSQGHGHGYSQSHGQNGQNGQNGYSGSHKRARSPSSSPSPPPPRYRRCPPHTTYSPPPTSSNYKQYHQSAYRDQESKWPRGDNHYSSSSHHNAGGSSSHYYRNY